MKNSDNFTINLEDIINSSCFKSNNIPMKDVLNLDFFLEDRNSREFLENCTGKCITMSGYFKSKGAGNSILVSDCSFNGLILGHMWWQQCPSNYTPTYNEFIIAKGVIKEYFNNNLQKNSFGFYIEEIHS